MKISIITPVYKAEKFLSRCVNSIIAQTYKDWELILVDDGSPDRSGKLCDDYAARDSRIRVIHKENGGVSSARQTGLETCTGEYIVHADSDDWLNPMMIEHLVNHIEVNDADVILFDFYRVTNGKSVLVPQKPSSLNHIRVLKDIIGGNLYASCWSKLVKKSTIMKYGASFPKGINLGEDKCFLASLMKNPVTVSYLPKALYFYDATINDGSLVRQITKSSIESGFAMVGYLEKELNMEFESSINNIKKNLKIRAIKSHVYSAKEIRSIYKELNTQCLVDFVLNRGNKRVNLGIILYSVGLKGICRRIINI